MTLSGAGRVPARGIIADSDFVETLGLDLIEGRNFVDAMDGSARRTFILNETAVRFLGEDDVIGKSLTFGDGEGTVVGVVKDFSYASVREEVEQLCLIYLPKWRGYNPTGAGFLAVRVHGSKVSDAIDHLGIAWQEVFPGMVLDYSFLDDEFAKLRQAEERMGKVMAAFSSLSIVVACLGLLGLASYAAQQRAKEIGVRKALGASSTKILAMLLGEYGVLVVVANVIAWPMAYLVSRRWLEDFAYRAEIPTEAFLAAGVTAAILALATVGYHGVRQSWADPVKALRDE